MGASQNRIKGAMIQPIKELKEVKKKQQGDLASLLVPWPEPSRVFTLL